MQNVSRHFGKVWLSYPSSHWWHSTKKNKACSSLSSQTLPHPPPGLWRVSEQLATWAVAGHIGVAGPCGRARPWPRLAHSGDTTIPKTSPFYHNLTAKSALRREALHQLSDPALGLTQWDGFRPLQVLVSGCWHRTMQFAIQPNPWQPSFHPAPAVPPGHHHSSTLTTVVHGPEEVASLQICISLWASLTIICKFHD